MTRKCTSLKICAKGIITRANLLLLQTSVRKKKTKRNKKLYVWILFIFKNQFLLMENYCKTFAGKEKKRKFGLLLK
jgi:hypothetical protein